MKYIQVFIVLLLIVIAVLAINNFRLNKNYSLSSNQPSIVYNTQELPYNLPPGFLITTYFKTDSPPRVLATDNENTIFVSLPQTGKIIALINQNSSTPKKLDIITSLNKPHGIAFFNNKLFIAEENQISRYDWNKKTLTTSLEKVLFSLPTGGNHTTRSIIFDNSGKMLVSIGSSCNVCVERNSWRGSIIVSDFEGNNPRIFASGLRNTVFMAVNSQNGDVWGADMGRDNLGDNLPSDEINIIKDGQNYGWPYCYGNQIFDKNFSSNSDSSVCNNTVTPIFEIPAHSAPLGLVFINSPKFPTNYQGGILVAYHGSWNSSTLKGYKVVHLEINNNQIVNQQDFITGFNNNSQVLGRPVALLFDKNGDLFLSDDKANTIYKIIYQP